MVDEFIRMLAERNQFQKRLLQEQELKEEERQGLKNILAFYMEKQGYSLELLAEAWYFINDMVMEETYYFVKNGSYRYSTFEEVNEKVYQNDEYMKKYMIGLSISDYLWLQHRKMFQWFGKVLESIKNRGGDGYLEIGSGLGQYLIRALKSKCFNDYLAVDLSPTSVKQCEEYLCYLGMDKTGYRIQQEDFFDFSAEKQFDFIVMGEVLEHVEQPEAMLEKINSLLAKTGRAFITTVINAPAIDHIYLFCSKEEVLDMVQRAGFLVEDCICVTAGDISLEKAVKHKFAVDIAMVLKKG